MKHFDMRRATAADIPTIIALAQASWRQTYTGLMPPGQLEYLLSLWYDPKTLANQLLLEGHECYLASLDNKPAGFLTIRLVEGGDYFLQRLYLDTAFARGLGTPFLARALELYPTVKSLRLRVHRLNVNAVNFYFKMGFKIERTLDETLDGGFLLPDYVMVKHYN